MVNDVLPTSVAPKMTSFTSSEPSSIFLPDFKPQLYRASLPRPRTTPLLFGAFGLRAALCPHQRQFSSFKLLAVPYRIPYFIGTTQVGSNSYPRVAIILAEVPVRTLCSCRILLSVFHFNHSSSYRVSRRLLRNSCIHQCPLTEFPCLL